MAQRVCELLDESVVVNNAEGLQAREFEAQFQIIRRGRTWDLSKIDFDKLRQDFKRDNVFHLVLDHAAQGRKWAAA